MEMPRNACMKYPSSLGTRGLGAAEAVRGQRMVIYLMVALVLIFSLGTGLLQS